MEVWHCKPLGSPCTVTNDESLAILRPLDARPPMSSSSPSPPCCHAPEGPVGLADGMERELARERTLLRRKVSVAAVLTGLVVLWTEPPRPMVCIEPWSGPRQALLSGDRKIELAPGASTELSTRYVTR